MSAPVRGHARVDKIGVGWGGNNVHFDFYHMVRSLALPHIRNATPLGVLLHFHTYVMLPCWTFSCTSTTTSDNFVLEAGSFQTGLNIKPFKHSFKVLTHMFKPFKHICRIPEMAALILERSDFCSKQLFKNMFAATLRLRSVWLQVDMKTKFMLLPQSTYIVHRGWQILISYEDKVDVITPINILFIGGGEFWSLMKIKLMLWPPSTYYS